MMPPPLFIRLVATAAVAGVTLPELLRMTGREIKEAIMRRMGP